MSLRNIVYIFGFPSPFKNVHLYVLSMVLPEGRLYLGYGVGTNEIEAVGTKQNRGGRYKTK